MVPQAECEVQVKKNFQWANALAYFASTLKLPFGFTNSVYRGTILKTTRACVAKYFTTVIYNLA